MPLTYPPVDSSGFLTPIVDYSYQSPQYNDPAALGDSAPPPQVNLFAPPPPAPPVQSQLTNTWTGSNTTGMLAGNLVGGAIGAYEFFHAQKQLKDLQNQPTPNYTVSPELQNAYSRAEGMANEGFTPQEKAGYQNQVNQGDASAYYRASRAAGGNLSNVISAGINSQNIADSSKMSIADANLRRENQQYADTLAAQIQAQKNKATAEQIQQYNLAQQAWGGAMNAGLQSFANSFSAGGLIKNVAPLLLGA